VSCAASTHYEKINNGVTPFHLFELVSCCTVQQTDNGRRLIEQHFRDCVCGMPIEQHIRDCVCGRLIEQHIRDGVCGRLIEQHFRDFVCGRLIEQHIRDCGRQAHSHMKLCCLLIRCHNMIVLTVT